MTREALKKLRIYQTTLSAGTGKIFLSSLNGCRSFYSAFGSGGADVFLYLIRHRDAPEWEAGTGHLGDAATLIRDTVIASSNNDRPVDFSAGEKVVTNNTDEGFHDA